MRLWTCLAVCSSLAVLAGCENGPPPKTPTGSGFPRWEGHAREVFDDNIDPASVGMQMDGGGAARGDKFLRERAQTADLVSRLRVQTVTVDSIGDDKRYHFGMQVGFPTLAEAKMKDTLFDIEVRSSSRGFEIAKAFDTRLRERTFIGFVSRFSGEDGELEYHWHLSADNAEVAAAVKEALALREITGS